METLIYLFLPHGRGSIFSYPVSGENDDHITFLRSNGTRGSIRKSSDGYAWSFEEAKETSIREGRAFLGRCARSMLACSARVGLIEAITESDVNWHYGTNKASSLIFLYGLDKHHRPTVAAYESGPDSKQGKPQIRNHADLWGDNSWWARNLDQVGFFSRGRIEWGPALYSGPAPTYIQAPDYPCRSLSEAKEAMLDENEASMQNWAKHQVAAVAALMALRRMTGAEYCGPPLCLA